eukprot:12521435-Alexandrium_andersonii.AAC.1
MGMERACANQRRAGAIRLTWTTHAGSRAASGAAANTARNGLTNGLSRGIKHAKHEILPANARTSRRGAADLRRRASRSARAS